MDVVRVLVEFFTQLHRLNWIRISLTSYTRHALLIFHLFGMSNGWFEVFFKQEKGVSTKISASKTCYH